MEEWLYGMQDMDVMVKSYKKNWAEKAKKDKLTREKLWHDALRVAKKLSDILSKDFHVKKVILFGSILDKDGFKEGSDIDIAVEGLSRDLYFAALGRLMMESPFDIDLKPAEDVSYLLKQRISKGKVLYEKRDHS
jgi:predicted nucleotidyltransferase